MKDIFIHLNLQVWQVAKGESDVVRCHLLVPSYSWISFIILWKGMSSSPLDHHPVERCGLLSLGGIVASSHSIHCSNFPKSLWAAFAALQTYTFPQLPMSSQPPSLLP